MVRKRKPETSGANLQAALDAGTGVDSLRRGLEILRLFDARHRSLQAAEIALKIGLSKISTAKLIATLEAHGFLCLSDQAGRYEPHVACLALGRAVKRGLGVVGIAQSGMRTLAEKFDVHVSLTTRDRLRMLVVEHCVPSRKIRLGLSTGTRFPITTSASGRAYLWAQPPAIRAKLLELLEDAEQDSSFKLLASVYAAFQELDENGWCFLASPVTSQTNSIATPIRSGDESDFVLAAMAVGGGDSELKLRDVVAPELLTLASQVSEELHGTTDP